MKSSVFLTLKSAAAQNETSKHTRLDAIDTKYQTDFLLTATPVYCDVTIHKLPFGSFLFMSF